MKMYVKKIKQINRFQTLLKTQYRFASFGSKKQWLNRWNNDYYVKLSKQDGYRSRAAYKLLKINNEFSIIYPGSVVVDLGYAPGAWSQVAAMASQSIEGLGLVVGVDLLPVQPPKGVCSVQGDFLRVDTQYRIKDLILKNISKISPKPKSKPKSKTKLKSKGAIVSNINSTSDLNSNTDLSLNNDRPLILKDEDCTVENVNKAIQNLLPVDVVLSDMYVSDISYFASSSKSINKMHDRLAATSGIKFRDHTYSMDLCYAALKFAIETVTAGGSFVCKVYQGEESLYFKQLALRAFRTVTYYKPPASRNESREIYLVACDKIFGVTHRDVFF